MPDSASSPAPKVQAQLDRLTARSPGRDVLGLDRIRALLARLDNPQHRLPPVFHVAGTNGKGSTCAYLRAALEAAGHRVHVYTSPHLVRFNERIRLAGRLIDDDALAALLAEANDAADGLNASFFEVTTAAALLGFARTPADACVIEVGLGGRLDATNILDRPLVTGIASLGIDHAEFLLAPDATLTAPSPITRIALEKAGIARPDVPMVTFGYADPVMEQLRGHFAALGTPWLYEGSDWSIEPVSDQYGYQDQFGNIYLPAPALAGVHQARNAGLAAAMLRHQSALPVDALALAQGLQGATWPARLQRLGPGPLTAMVPLGELWLDGAHNPDAASQVADFFRQGLAERGPVDLIIGMLANKDAPGVLAELAPITRRLIAVPVPGHDHYSPEALTKMAAEAGIAQAEQAADIADALRRLQSPPAGGRRPRGAAIVGSLYLAAQALGLNGEVLH